MSLKDILTKKINIPSLESVNLAVIDGLKAFALLSAGLVSPIISMSLSPSVYENTQRFEKFLDSGIAIGAGLVAVSLFYYGKMFYRLYEEHIEDVTQYEITMLTQLKAESKPNPSSRKQ